MARLVAFVTYMPGILDSFEGTSFQVLMAVKTYASVATDRPPDINLAGLERDVEERLS
ncbi:MAG: hypothetical protein IVW54_01595 [Candidatus Binataceae bacterium]|nr:hypothetical protein [Candidatus Binataceae bacterium]